MVAAESRRLRRHRFLSREPQKKIRPRPASQTAQQSWDCCRTGPNLKTGRKLFHQDFVDGKIFTVTLK